LPLARRCLPPPAKRGLEPLGKRRKESAESGGPRGPNERERASHWAGVRGSRLIFRGGNPLKHLHYCASQYASNVP
jgi:hypothetical protein